MKYSEVALCSIISQPNRTSRRAENETYISMVQGTHLRSFYYFAGLYAPDIWHNGKIYALSVTGVRDMCAFRLSEVLLHQPHPLTR